MRRGLVKRERERESSRTHIHTLTIAGVSIAASLGALLYLTSANRGDSNERVLLFNSRSNYTQNTTNARSFTPFKAGFAVVGAGLLFNVVVAGCFVVANEIY